MTVIDFWLFNVNEYYRAEFAMIMEFKFNFGGEQAILYVL